jgi:hypothetical protein
VIRKNPTWLHDNLQDKKGLAVDNNMVRGFTQIEGFDFIV